MRALFSILTVLFLLILSSCIKEVDPSLDQYLFLEQHTSVSGELVSGPEPPLLHIDFPTYTFDEETGELVGIVDFSINKNLKMIYASGSSLSGTAGAGVATGLDGVYDIPFERGSFELLKLDDAGNVVFMYNDGVFNLKPGEEWTDQSTRLDTVMVDNEMSISSITTINRISNFGFQQKSNIQSWDW
ncbi:MAG TPA: hypothetical protein PK335_10980 [Draconibacterium sp.]|nr:hypothetical protein [Draconibacterium sp.]